MQVLFTTVGGRRFALDCAEILEVLPVVAHRPAGTGPKWLLGLFNLRGTLVPLVDLGVIVDGTPTTMRLGARIVVMRLDAELIRDTPKKSLQMLYRLPKIKKRFAAFLETQADSAYLLAEAAVIDSPA